ncbi:MAG: hypothetical protein CMM07_25620 [Rhodopirellula sp.]|nr:hypothetical protein [Rhodopirellula sp.]
MANDIENALNDAGFETVRIDKASVRDGPIWTCKIGLKEGTSAVLPGGCDFPMRSAVEAEFKRITGHDCDFNFSGWGGELTKLEKEIV